MRSKSSMSETMFSMMRVHVVRVETALSPCASLANAAYSGPSASIWATFLHARSGLRRSCITTRMSLDLASCANVASAALSSASSWCCWERCHALVALTTDRRKCHWVRSARTRSQWARATIAAMRPKTVMVRTPDASCVRGSGKAAAPQMAAPAVTRRTQAICTCCRGVKRPATMIMASPRERASASDHSHSSLPPSMLSASALSLARTIWARR
mmetsp:Transcript_13728/g.41476  ORF Transcript_13728/g.41476 Transcript_13728/m.41476 type:complete len:215 (-) Transcript_13728:117-761(-)